MKIDKRVLVYGATGLQGTPILKALIADGYHPVALTRGAGTCLPEGVERAKGDFLDGPSLCAAQEGIGLTVLLLPLVFDADAVAQYMQNVIVAAKTAGVRRLVFDTSAPVPRAPVGVAALDVKLLAMRMLAESGLDVVTVSPTIYAGNLAAPWSASGIVREKVIAYPLLPSIACSWITWEDAASAVVAVLGRMDLAGQSIKIGGPEALTGDLLAAAFDAERGPGHRYMSLPLDGFEAGLSNALGADAGREITALYRYLSVAGAPLLQVNPDWQDILGVKATPMSAWIGCMPWDTLATGQAPR